MQYTKTFSPPGVKDELVNRGLIGLNEEVDKIARIINRTPWVDVRDYGAKGDGVTDNTLRIQAVIDSIPVEGGTVLIPEGRFLSSTIDLKSNLKIISEGGGELVAIANDTVLLRAAGSLTPVADLTVQGTERDDSITLASVIGLSIGDFILISSDEADNPVDYPTIDMGEIRRIVNIAGNVVSIEGGLWATYTLAENATVDRVNVCENVEINNLIVTGADMVESGWGINGYLAHNLRIINNKVRSHGYCNIGLQSCINSLIDGNFISDAQKPTSGYGVSTFNACSNIIISNNEVRRCRHLTMWGGGAAVKGVPNKVSIIGNTLQNSIIAAAVDAHGLGGEINIVGNIISDSATQGIRVGCRYINIADNIFSNLYSYAVSLRGSSLVRSLTVTGNKSSSGPGGVYMHDDNGQTAIERIVITGNSFASTIALWVNNPNFNGAIVSDNYLDALGSSYGIWLQGVNDFVISGNNIRNSLRSAIHVFESTRGVIEGNLLKDNNKSDSDTAYRDSHINLWDSTYISIANNRYYDSIPLVRLLVREYGSCDYNDLSLKENEGVGYTVQRYLLIGANSRVHFELHGSYTWDPPSIDDGNEAAENFTVTGAEVGDYAIASFSLDVADLVLNAQVTGANTVTCILANNTGGAIDLVEGTVYVKVIKK